MVYVDDLYSVVIVAEGEDRLQMNRCRILKTFSPPARHRSTLLHTLVDVLVCAHSLSSNAVLRSR